MSGNETPGGADGKADDDGAEEKEEEETVAEQSKENVEKEGAERQRASAGSGFEEEPAESTHESADPFGLETNLDGPPDGDDEPATEGSHATTSEESGANADAPLGSIAASVDERRNRDTDRPDDGLFDEESVPEIDTDVVWEQLDDADSPAERPDDAEEDVRVIEKRSYCEQCPFFSEPPEVSCSHEGTEILELVNMEQFRVVDCPKVREDERLERL